MADGDGGWSLYRPKEDGIPMCKWGYGKCPYCGQQDTLLYWVRGDRDTLQCQVCIDEADD